MSVGYDFEKERVFVKPDSIEQTRVIPIKY